MGAAHLPKARAHRGGEYLGRPQLLHEQAYPQDIHHRVQRPHLVEMHQLHRPAVYLGLRLGDAAIYCQHLPLDLGRYAQALDQPLDLPHAPMGMPVVVPVGMVVLVPVVVLVGMVVVVLVPVVVLVGMVVVMVVGVVIFLLAMDPHLHFAAGDAAAQYLLGLHGYAGYAQAVEPGEEAIGIGMQIQQRPHEHIPRRAHAAIQIQSFHIFVSPKRLIIWAR